MGPLRAPDIDTPCHLWPCNVWAWRLWLRLQTQWAVGGMSGRRTGLRYDAVWVVLTGLGWRPRRRREAFACVQAMERAALDAWDEQQPDRTPISPPG